jgi:TatA/E family protein of Tat protein translocase
MGALQPTHLLIVAAVALLVLGPSKLPQLARSIGESLRELKKSLSGITDSEPVNMVKELGQSVSDLKADLNPLSPPRSPRSASAPAAVPPAANPAPPSSESNQGSSQS